MSFWYTDLTKDRPMSVAGGQSSLAEIYSAATEQLRYVDNSNSSSEALSRAYADRIRAIQEATGETTVNPMEEDRRDLDVPGDPSFTPTAAVPVDPMRQAQRLQANVDRFNTWLADVAKRHPTQSGVIRADVPVDRDAEAIARHADEKLAQTLAARDGVGKWAALFAGGIRGSFYDPLQAMALLAGGGPGAARTVGGRILTVALKEAAINGGVEAIMQPDVQAWRAQVGLEAGFVEGAKNVAFAAGLGGAFGGMLQGGVEGVSRILRGRGLDHAAEFIAANPGTRAELREGLTGDGARAAELLAPIRQALPADARGAMDALSLTRHIDDLRPASATPEVHEQAIARAVRAAQENVAYHFEADPAQVERIVARLVPEARAAAQKSEATLQQFLMRAGGVQDFKGELAALGLGNASERFVGRLVREGGLPLDEARRAAAEAGYFNHLYGTPDEAMAKSTVSDLLDELDTASRETGRAIDDGGRSYAEGLVHELVARAGPAVDDNLILKAADLANAEGLAPADALDRVLIAADEADRSAEAAVALPTAPERIDQVNLRGGLDDPGRPLEDTFFSDADLADIPDDFEIPFFDDGRAATPEALVAELERLDDLSMLVEACRV